MDTGLPAGWQNILRLFVVDEQDFTAAFNEQVARFKNYVPSDWIAAASAALTQLQLTTGSPGAILEALIAAGKSGYWKSHGGVA
jgi:hypothetical protein